MEYSSGFSLVLHVLAQISLFFTIYVKNCNCFIKLQTGYPVDGERQIPLSLCKINQFIMAIINILLDIIDEESMMMVTEPACFHRPSLMVPLSY